MKAANLIPSVEQRELFDKSKEKFVPVQAGCYVLTTFDGDILYIGLAENIQRRMSQHLNNPKKTRPVNDKRATAFHWRVIESDDGERERVERGWLGQYATVNGGNYPPFNKNSSPVSG